MQLSTWTKYLTGIQMGMALLERIDAASADGVVTDEEVLEIVRTGLAMYEQATGKAVEIRTKPTELAPR